MTIDTIDTSRYTIKKFSPPQTMTVTMTIREVVDSMMFLAGVVAERIAVIDEKGIKHGRMHGCKSLLEGRKSKA